MEEGAVDGGARAGGRWKSSAGQKKTRAPFPEAGPSAFLSQWETASPARVIARSLPAPLRVCDPGRVTQAWSVDRVGARLVPAHRAPASIGGRRPGAVATKKRAPMHAPSTPFPTPRRVRGVHAWLGEDMPCPAVGNGWTAQDRSCERVARDGGLAPRV